VTATWIDQIFEDIVETIRAPLIVLDNRLRVVLVSRFFYKVFKVTPEETVGRLIYDIGKMLKDIGVPIDMDDFPTIMESLKKSAYPRPFWRGLRKAVPVLMQH